MFSWVTDGLIHGTQNKVLSANNVAVAEEILSYPQQTIINMPLSQAVNSSATNDESKTASNQAMVGGSAFTNENNALDGSFTIDDEGNGNDQISLYTVRSGDTVPLIAKMFGVSPNTIYWANDMKAGSTVKPDQVIVILPITGIKYTVKKGDHVEDLAKKFKSDVGEIVSFNNIDTSVGLTAGQEIIIPDAELQSPVVSKPGKNTNPGGPVSTIGYFRRPINGGIKTQGIHGHNGVDLASFGGAHIPILAAADGTVIISKSGGWNGGYGNYVVIKHPNGMQTLYGHMSANLVASGDHVTKGQQIGNMGSTGQSTGVHLHFEVRGGRNPF